MFLLTEIFALQLAAYAALASGYWSAVVTQLHAFDFLTDISQCGYILPVDSNTEPSRALMMGFLSCGTRTIWGNIQNRSRGASMLIGQNLSASKRAHSMFQPVKVYMDLVLILLLPIRLLPEGLATNCGQLRRRTLSAANAKERQSW